MGVRLSGRIFSIPVVIVVAAMPLRAKPIADKDTQAPADAASRQTLDRHSSLELTPRDDAAVFHATAAVDIAEGTWKYLQMEIQHEGKQRLIVRSFQNVHYHAEVYDRAAAQLAPHGITCRVVGGGRIRRDSQNRIIDVFGYSKSYGPSPGCNERTAHIIIDFVRGTYKVRWSEEGY